MLTREVIVPQISRRASVLMVAFCATTMAVLCAAAVARARVTATHDVDFVRGNGKLFCDGCYATNLTSVGVTRFRDVTIGDGKRNVVRVSAADITYKPYALDWYVTEPLTPARMTVLGPVLHIGPAVLGFDVELPIKGEHHTAALCFDIDHSTPDDCLYFDEARTP